MDVQAVKDSLRRLDADGSLEVGEASRPVRRWLRQVGLPAPLCDVLGTGWPRRYCPDLSIGGYALWPARKIMTDEDTPALLEARMVPIGTTVVFDFAVVRFDRQGTFEVGLVSHDLLWETRTPPAACYTPVCESLAALFRHAEHGGELPQVYFDLPHGGGRPIHG